mmetsp:Transcript_7339/g.13533  ORF Transcript_7339/g.13533 Transcript_7339/m.13533 type:complete len:239 (+) Transcript_7339:609-1325(+)|eukprot:CAMPEP_0178732414 /NCGR_PEP_ID=MMETSP0744-20121128/251_1 /TAXON_ID=913974 /ORGANISM="Nitzschia punctata, Strain CCMP561" /LENGTH=238 /DNA_ID=CAMNT_0020384533 /DNA_START=112 /DNA_END=828 /DNA_ORIENTATION=-
MGNTFFLPRQGIYVRRRTLQRVIHSGVYRTSAFAIHQGAARDDNKSSSPRALRSRMTKLLSLDQAKESAICYDWTETWGNRQILLHVDNGHKMLGRANVKGTGTLQAGTFIGLEDVKEFSTVNKDRYVSRMALAADSVVLLVTNPASRRNKRITKENFIDDLVGKVVLVRLTSGYQYQGELVSNQCGVLRLAKTEEFLDGELAGYLGDVLIKWFSLDDPVDGTRRNGGIMYVKELPQE